MFLLLMPSDEPFHSPVSFNVISIAGIHFVVLIKIVEKNEML